VKSDDSMIAIQEKIADTLRRELQDNLIGETRMFPNRPVFTVRKDALIQALSVLVETFDARFCTITALDNGVDFELLYHMAIKGLVLNIRVIVPKEESELASVTRIMPGAISAEREVWDLFQIRFQGLADSRAIVVPYEWRDVNAPLRKPIGGVVSNYQKPTVEKMMQAGQVFPIPSTVISQRDGLKLPPIVSTTFRPEAVEEIHKMAQEVGFDKKIGYDMGKNRLRY
jgi:Ni,Fe-hydrogenase III component G